MSVEKSSYTINPKEIIERGLKVGLNKTAMAEILGVRGASLSYYIDRESVSKSQKADWFGLEAKIVELEMGAGKESNESEGESKLVAVRMDIRTQEIKEIKKVGEDSSVSLIREQLREKIESMEARLKAVQSETQTLEKKIQDLSEVSRALLKLQEAGDI